MFGKIVSLAILSYFNTNRELSSQIIQCKCLVNELVETTYRYE